MARGWIKMMVASVASAMALAFVPAASAQPKFDPNSEANPAMIRGFEVSGSNGYTLDVYGLPRRKGSPAEVIVQAWNAHTSTSYSTDGKVSDELIQADFGPFGRVSVRFDRAGVKRLGSACDRGPYFVVAGTFRGSIEFEGEGGFTGVSDPGLEVEPLYRDSWECTGAKSTRGGSPGVLLQVLSKYGETQVIQNAPGKAVRFMANAVNRIGKVEVHRWAEIFARPVTFDWRSSLKWARVTPPPPFTGIATYRALDGRVTHWEGNLRVDFAGFPGYPLTVGPSLTSFEHGQCFDSPPVEGHGSGPPLGLCRVGW